MSIEAEDTGDKVVSVRIDVESLSKLQALAVIDRSTVGHEIRNAVAEYIDQRSADPALAEAVTAAKERQLAVLSVFDAASGKARNGKRSAAG